jgi:N4-gp56 family major capsid protein
MAQKAERITQVLSGSPNYGTSPIQAAFIAVASTDIDADLRNLAGFVPVAEYGSRKPMSEHECGSVEGVRYILTPQISPWADAGASTSTMVSTSGSNADVYPILYFGKEAFGCVPLKGKESVTPIVINPNNPSAADPLGQRGYVGWKTYYTCVILNESWMARLESGATDLA